MSDLSDYIYDNEPVCPHCGQHMSDAWELELEDGNSKTVECGECLKEYVVIGHLSVTYTSKTLERAR